MLYGQASTFIFSNSALSARLAYNASNIAHLISYLITLREYLMPLVHILDMSYIIWHPNNYTARKNARFKHSNCNSIRCFKGLLALTSLEFWILTVLLGLLDNGRSNNGPVFFCIWR